MSEFTDKLIRKAASGNQDAITELYELTYSSVYKTVKSMIADEDTVLDIVQDSFIKGFQSLDQLDAPENFRAWMKRIATNKAKDYLKKKKPILFTDMENEDGEEIDFRDDCLEHCPEEVLDRKETTRLMNEILATLSEEQRLVIGMFYYEEMSVREIAETLGCSENTVKSRLNYGRKKVEAKVRELEKSGTKLYSLAPLPFLLWLLRMDAQAAEIPSCKVLEAVTAECAATGTAAGAVTAAGVGAKAAASVGVKALSTKIIAGVLAVSVVGGGAMLALSSRDREGTEPIQPSMYEETGSYSETTLSVEQETGSYSETTLPAEQETVSADAVYETLLEDYRSACAVSHEEWQNNMAAYQELYSNLDADILLSYHFFGVGELFFAYHDIDGNGTCELFLGIGADAASAYPYAAYASNGSEAVQICSVLSTVLADGTILESGNGGGIARVLQIGSDGFTLVEKTNTDIASGSMLFDLDLSSHGGSIILNWEELY